MSLGEKELLLKSWVHDQRSTLTSFLDFSWITDLKERLTYESLDYELIENSLAQRELNNKTEVELKKYYFMHWVVAFAIGMCTALIAFGIDSGVFYLSKAKFQLTNILIASCADKHCVWAPLLVYLGFSILFTFISTFLATYIEPAATGSGVPEVKSYLNGVRIPKIVRMKTLFVKAIGVLFALSGGLVIGKAAPMIHCGAIVAAGVSQGQALSFSRRGLGFLKYFRNDHEKRDFVSAGAAAGIAAAFGAPIGGVLFSIEDGVSFWRQSLLWRTFFCSMVSTFTLNFFLSGTRLNQTDPQANSGWGTFSQAGLVNFGTFDSTFSAGYNITQFPFFLLLGVCGGVLGASFNAMNVKLTKIRQLWSHKNHIRVVEACVIGLITAGFSFGISYLFPICKTIDPTTQTYIKVANFNFYCGANEYNEMAALFFNTQENSIKELFHETTNYSFIALFIFFVVYYCIACITFGASVPSGLFVPGLLVGCTLGRLFGQLLSLLLPGLGVNPGTFALLGAAAMLGGIFRMTIALTVILIETTNDISYGLPIMVTLMSAKFVGDFFNRGIYDIHISFRKIPYLGWDSPHWMRKYRAADVMSRPVQCFQKKERVKKVIKVLQDTTHNGFPIVDNQGHFIGLILRTQLTMLMTHQMFVPSQDSRDFSRKFIALDDFRKAYPRYPEIEEVHVTAEEEDMYIDMTPYMNPLPYTIQQNATLARVFSLFRTMGLRHLVVVSEENKIVGIITRKDVAYLEERFLMKKMPTSDELLQNDVEYESNV